MSSYKLKSGVAETRCCCFHKAVYIKAAKAYHFFRTNTTAPQPQDATIQPTQSNNDLGQLQQVDKELNFSVGEDSSPPLVISQLSLHLKGPSTWRESLNSAPEMTGQLIRLGPAAAHNRSTSYPASKREYNDGNYINTLKLLAKFDAFIAGHIAKYADKGRESVSYLSSTIAHEFIAVIAEKITDTIVAELKRQNITPSMLTQAQISVM
ncbi:Zinc finger MYM-type protein 1-like [Oopsacas minuta]|uniref:Zinc finger MYM-type protein 1-like n=1 Tax=Oopsacas minuta TaxID=111878 RepID=A0AAV7KIB4_9METZ|nr:Zinc finger MYM-type protein 1-like [Oopsacas minuta]